MGRNQAAVVPRAEGAQNGFGVFVGQLEASETGSPRMWEPKPPFSLLCPGGCSRVAGTHLTMMGAIASQVPPSLASSLQEPKRAVSNFELQCPP